MHPLSLVSPTKQFITKGNAHLFNSKTYSENKGKSLLVRLLVTSVLFIMRGIFKAIAIWIDFRCRLDGLTFLQKKKKKKHAVAFPP